jgi:hypothetical protein
LRALRVNPSLFCAINVAYALCLRSGVPFMLFKDVIKLRT